VGKVIFQAERKIFYYWNY